METVGEAFEEVVRSPLSTWILPLALCIHFVCAFNALLRRYSFRSFTVYQWSQYVSGFLLPLFLIGHFATIGISRWVLGMDIDYELVFLEFWGVPIDTLFLVSLLALAGVHVGLGIWFYLQSKEWFVFYKTYILFILVLTPLLALLGVIAGGREASQREHNLPNWAEQVRSEAHYSQDWEETREIGSGLAIAGYLSILGLVLSIRWVVGRRAQKQSITVSYPDGQKVSMTKGSTLLEASNLAHIAHAQLCQGHGRCSTCRVYVAEGEELLEPMDEAERAVLSRFRSNTNIRLACQARALGNCRIDLLISPELASVQASGGKQRFISEEKEIIVLFSDIRGFTQFSEHRLPYDVVFILNRYFQEMGRVIEKHGGYLDKFIGDGTMAIFGLSDGMEKGANQALKATEQMAETLHKLNSELTSDLAEPLKIGVGVHAGKAIVGEMGYKSALTLTAIGDTVNTASRLEAMTKEVGCFMICSDLVAQLAGLDCSHLTSGELLLRGKSTPLKVWYTPYPAPR